MQLKIKIKFRKLNPGQPRRTRMSKNHGATLASGMEAKPTYLNLILTLFIFSNFPHSL